MQNTKLLVVMDESKASERAVSYVAQIVGRRRGFKVCLAHTLPELPASLIEYGSARNPDDEKKLEAELHAEQKHWVFAAREKGRPALKRARTVLRNGGVAAASIEERFCYPAEGRARGDEILELAREQKCHTVVVGSESLSWLKQLLGNDPVEELLRRGKGFTIWVVESARMCARTVQIAAMQTAPRQPKVVLTVGHSTRAQDDFIALLRAHGVKRLVDIRTIPRSRHNPQFNRDQIGAALRRAGITYLHMKALGGLRHARPDSLNTAWRNASFRGFADYMQTREFARGLRRLMGMARTKQTAIMCAEAVPWRCHRSLIADALLAHGYRVDEIESLKRTRPHVLTPWARLLGSKISYPSAEVAAGEQAERKGDTPTRIKLKPAYEPAVASDGARYLVERLWSRGMKKTALRIDAWLRDVAPSTALRQWFNHDPKKWEQFQRRYSRELDASPDAVRSLLTAAQRGTVTLVYSSHDSLHNNAVALKKYLEQKLAKSAGPSRKSAA